MEPPKWAVGLMALICSAVYAEPATQPAREIPLALVYSTSNQKELRNSHEGPFIERTFGEVPVAAIGWGSDFRQLAKGKLMVLAGGGKPVEVAAPVDAEAQPWAVVYFGSSGSSPPQWLIDSVRVLEGGVFEVVYHKPPPGMVVSSDLRQYVAWIPLGKLAAGKYSLRLVESGQVRLEASWALAKGGGKQPEPAIQPSKLAAERAGKLLRDLKTFTLQLNYHAQVEEKPYYCLLLSVPQVPKAEANPFFRQAQITEIQAEKIVERFAKDGYLHVAMDGSRNASPVPPKEPYYSLTVRVENGGKPVQFEEWLTLNKELFQRLDGLRTVLEGDAAKNMDLLLGRLSGHRKEGEKVATSQPTDAAKITEDRAKELAKRHLADKGLDWGEPVKVVPVVTDYKLYYATPQSEIAHGIGQRVILVTGTGEVRVLPRR